MADNILRLTVQSSEYDAKLKKAAEGIRHLAEVAHKGGGELTGLEKAELDYIKSLGTMETKSRTAAGSVRELESVFKELTVVYNHLNDVEKQDEGGKALRASLDQIKQRAQAARAELEAASKSLQGMEANSKVDIGGGIFSGIGSKMEGALAVFGGNLMTKAAGAVAQLGSEMADMVKQGIEMAKAGEGVRIAFERLGNGQILDGLREATHGTVTDIELMKAAVKFNDFKLPLDELGTMLAFAQQKAKDTGQSVDYMVDSIVTGLGRKSLMILDNLGLSATEIRERMKETGDMTKAVGAIIRDQMKNAGDYVETAADRAAQANVTLQNKMEELGRKFGPVEEASNQLWTSMKIGILDIIGGPLATMLNQLTEAGRLRNQLNKMNGDPSTGQPTKVQQQLSTLRGSNYKNANYKGQLSQYDKQISTYQTMIDNGGKLPGAPAGSGKDVRWLQSQLDALKVMRSEYVQGAKDIMKPVEANVKTDKAEQNVKTLTAQLKELEKQRKEAVKKGDQEQVESLTKQISQTKTNLGYLDHNAAKSGNGGNKTDIKFASDSIMAQEKLISDLTQKWKTASGAVRDDYAAQLDEAKAKLKEMTAVDNLPTFTMAELEGTRPKSIDLRGNEGKAQDKLDLATAAFATSGTSNVDFSNYTSALQNAIKDINIGSELYTQLSEQLKDATTVSTLLQELMERGMAGADLENTAQALKDKLLSPEGIDQEAVQAWLDELNKQIEEAGGVGLKLNSETGEVSDDKGKNENDLTTAINKATIGVNALSNINSGLKGMGIDLGEDIGNAISIVQSMMTVIQGVQAVVSMFQTPAIVTNTFALETLTSTLIAKSFLPGFANGGIVPAFAQSGLIGRAAAGMMIPGNSMSGDRLRLPVDGGRGMIGVNSGELILNKSSQDTLAADLLNAEALIGSIKDYSASLGNAQQGVIAQELEGGGFDNLQLDARVSAEDIIFILNNNGNRRGYGDFIND